MEGKIWILVSEKPLLGKENNGIFMSLIDNNIVNYKLPKYNFNSVIGGANSGNNKRKPIGKGYKKLILDAQQGKCKECGESFKGLGVRPQFHHKSMNTQNNSPSNLIAICPSCHDKIHQKLKKKKVLLKDSFGFVYGTKTKVIGKTTKKRKNKTKKKPKKKEPQPTGYNIFGNSPKLDFKW